MHRDTRPNPRYDAAWIFTLWRALHGGDPTPGDVAAEVISSLAQFLPAQGDSFGLLPLPASPYIVAVSEIEDSESADPEEIDAVPAQEQPQEPHALLCYDPREFSIHHYYFNFKGVFYCLDRPAFACLPTAA